METKANTALIGAFTLVALALGFVFIYWLARGSEQSSNAELMVVFNDPVTGLTVGSQVVFNGINVGTVKRLTLDPEHPRSVNASLSVQPLRSIKQDTEVTLGFQGLTGVGYVEMAGGSQKLPPIWEAMPKPTIVAKRSSMQDLMAGARTILARTDETLQTIEKLVSDNSDDVTQAVRDVRKFTGALSQNSDGIAKLVDEVSKASAGIADATARLQGIVERGESVIAAVDPEQVRRTISNIEATTETVAGQMARFDSIVQRANSISSDVQSFSEHLPALGTKAEALAAAIDPEKVGATLDRLESLTAAIDPEKVRITVDNVADTAAAVGAHSEQIGSIVARADTIAGNLDAFSQRLPSLGEKADALAGAIDPAKIGATVDRLDSLTAAIDPEKVRITVDNVADTAAAVGAHSEQIGSIVARADTIAANLDTFSQRLPSLGEKADAIAGAIDPAKIGATVDRLDSLTAAVDPEKVRTTVDGMADAAAVVGAHSEQIGSIVARADTIAGNLDTFSQRLPALGEKADALAGAIDPAKVSSAIEKLDSIAAAVDPEKVRTSVDGIASLATTLQNNRENIDALVARATVLSADLAAFAGRLPALGDKASSLFASIDPDKVGRTLENVDSFTTALAANTDDIDAIVADARKVAARFDNLGNRADSLLTKLDSMAGEGTGGLLADARETLVAVRKAADSFSSQVNTVGSGLGDFSGRGLRDFQNLISEGQRAISRLDGVVSNLEQNPSGFIFGGSSVPEYSGRRR